MAGVIELVTLRPRPDLDDDAFLVTVPATMEFLQTRPGFIRRRLARAADGHWLDYVEWRTMDEALAAAAAFNDDPRNRAFNAAVAPGSAVMRHYTVAAASG
jgi:hypothetical protein